MLLAPGHVYLPLLSKEIVDVGDGVGPVIVGDAVDEDDVEGVDDDDAVDDVDVDVDVDVVDVACGEDVGVSTLVVAGSEDAEGTVGESLLSTKQPSFVEQRKRKKLTSKANTQTNSQSDNHHRRHRRQPEGQLAQATDILVARHRLRLRLDDIWRVLIWSELQPRLIHLYSIICCYLFV